MGAAGHVHPNEALLRMPLRGCAAYRLPWIEAHLWVYAEHYGLSPLYSEGARRGGSRRSVTRRRYARNGSAAAERE